MMYFAEFTDLYGEVFQVGLPFHESEEVTVKDLLEVLSSQVDGVAVESVSFYVAKPLKVTVRYEVSVQE